MTKASTQRHLTETLDYFSTLGYPEWEAPVYQRTAGKGDYGIVGEPHNIQLNYALFLCICDFTEGIDWRN